MTRGHALKRERWSKPCPQDCGRNCDMQSVMCLPCRRGSDALSKEERAAARAEARMRDAEFSGRAWDGITQFSSTSTATALHVATCSLCGRTTEPSDVQEWLRAVVERVCGVPGCRGWLEIRLTDLSSAHGSVEPSVPIAIKTRAFRVVPRRGMSA